MELADRVAMLEKRNRQLLGAVGGLAILCCCSFLAGSTENKDQRVIRAKRVEIVDKAGVLRGDFGMNVTNEGKETGSAMRLYDGAGRALVKISAEFDGGFIFANEAGGNSAVRIQATPVDAGISAEYRWSNENPLCEINIIAANSGEPYLQIRDTKKKVSVKYPRRGDF